MLLARSQQSHPRQFASFAGSSSILYVHGRPQRIRDWLIDRLDSHKALSPAVSLCQFFKQVYDVIHLIRSLRPFADTAETAVIEAILAKRHGVKVNEDADSVLLRPVKSFVKLFQAADKRLAIPINEVRDRDSDRIQSHTCDGCEVAFRDKPAAVLAPRLS